MTQLTQVAPDSAAIIQRERLLHLLALMNFIIFFQAYMVAPISNATNMEQGSHHDCGTIQRVPQKVRRCP